MCVEAPQIADIVARFKGIRTRTGGAGVMEGSPRPLVIKNLLRVLDIDKRLYGNTALIPCSQRDLSPWVKRLNPPLPFNLLAMAAPHLRSQAPGDQFSDDTVKDLFNTLYAGFTCARQNTAQGKACIIHSGKLGCGVFNNNPLLVLLLHVYISHVLNVQVVMHGYTREEWEEGQRVFGSCSQALLRAPTLERGVEIIANACRPRS